MPDSDWVAITGPEIRYLGALSKWLVILSVTWYLSRDCYSLGIWMSKWVTKIRLQHDGYGSSALGTSINISSLVLKVLDEAAPSARRRSR
jgi:hypothetical protein